MWQRASRPGAASDGVGTDGATFVGGRWGGVQSPHGHIRDTSMRERSGPQSGPKALGRAPAEEIAERGAARRRVNMVEVVDAPRVVWRADGMRMARALVSAAQWWEVTPRVPIQCLACMQRLVRSAARRREVTLQRPIQPVTCRPCSRPSPVVLMRTQSEPQ